MVWWMAWWVVWWVTEVWWVVWRVVWWCGGWSWGGLGVIWVLWASCLLSGPGGSMLGGLVSGLLVIWWVV